MSALTAFLGLRYPQENVDYMRASLDIEQAYKDIDAFAEKIADPIRGMMTCDSDVIRLTGVLFQVHFNTANYNVGGIVNLANDRFTIPTDDVYVISAQVRWTNGVTGTARKAQLQVNNNVKKIDVVDEPSNNGDGGATNTIYYESEFNAGDQITLWARHDNGSALNPGVESNFGGTWMKIRRASFVN